MRKDDFIGATDNCTYGITAGSIESERASRCFDFRRLSETDLAASNVPNCRDVMPRFDSVVSQDNSTQATLVVALIGVGLLSIALIVLVFILLRRCRHAKKKDHPVELNSIRFEGLQPTAGSQFAGSQAELEEGLVAGLGGQKQNQLSKIGTQSKKQREKLAKRLAHSDGGEAGHGGPGGIAEGREPGSGAGIIEEDVRFLWCVCFCVVHAALVSSSD